MDKNKKKSLVELFTGVPFFKKVLEIMISKVFIDLDNPCPDGCTIVGVMSPLERACWTVFVKRDKEIEDYLDDLQDFMFNLILSRIQKDYPDLKYTHLHQGFSIMIFTEVDTSKTIEVFEGIEEMSLEEMLEVSLKNTFLEPIFDIFETGKFIDARTSIKDGEVIICEMTTLEKVLWTIYSHLFENREAKIEELQKLMKSDTFFPMGIAISVDGYSCGINTTFIGKKDHPETIKAENLEKEISLLDVRSEPLLSLFSTVVYSDFLNGKYANIGVRKNFKIVNVD
jgi:hypothetical protein